MKICAAQTKPVKGNIAENIRRHLQWIEVAALHGADIIVFSELSLTGYEPELAKDLATTADDRRLDVFQKVSDSARITIAIGVPIKNEGGISISMVIFQPGKKRLTYSKKYLHPDEYPFFVPGENLNGILINGTMVGFAICYELSIPEHSGAAYNSGCQVYIASVAKFANGVEKAVVTLSEIASQYSIPVVMSNAVGPADNGVCTGNSSAWDNTGILKGKLNSTEAGILIFDTSTGQTIINQSRDS